MRGWAFIALCGLAVLRLYKPNVHFAFYLALITAVANLWSFGVLHNYGDNPYEAPNSWALVNIASTVIGAGLLVYSFFI